MRTPAEPVGGRRWMPGDHLGLDIPADAGSLRAGGADFLTRAFRRAGVLADTNAVTAIDELHEFRGGSTGRKATLTVSYATDCELPRELFVKFSRDLDDPARDAGREQMAGEARFALLTRAAEFPIEVPNCLFADFHAATGTGILITNRIDYGGNGIEPHYDKCADYLMPDPVGHYSALLSALARLAGTDKAEGLAARLDLDVEMRGLSVGARAPLSPAQLLARVDLLGELAARQPALLPADIVSPEALARFRAEAPRVPDRVDALWQILESDDRYIALCHWNANVDNAWFWQTPEGDLRCGLLDWGCVGRMNVAMAIWGALVSAETTMWDNHFEALLTHFTDEYAAAGGPVLDVSTLRDHVLAYAVIMGTTWLLDVPAYLLRLLPEPGADRFHPLIAGDEQARSRLLMMTNFLNLWQRADTSRLLGTD